MTRLRRVKHDVRDASGAVLVFVALCFPVFIGFAGLVLDVGNWFAHKRHLQVQADAGALAGAGSFRIPCDDAAIQDEIDRYTSATLPVQGYNPQIGDTPRAEIHQLINSPTWPEQGSEPVDTSVVEGDPCAAKMIDVKLTETDLPWWLRAAQVPFINAHARVEIRQQTRSSGALPVGVPEVNPGKVRAIFVDETKSPGAAGYVLAESAPLRKLPGQNADGLTLWTTLDEDGNPAPVDVRIKSGDIGVRVAVSGGSSTTCGDPLVDCYDAGGANGLVHIRGYSPTTLETGAAPQARTVQLLPSATTPACEDPYFTATASAYSCRVDVAAEVAFAPGTDLTKVRVGAFKTGANTNTAEPLALVAGKWKGGAIPIARDDGPVRISLFWQTGCDNANCTGPGTANGTIQVHRIFSATTDRSGPVKLVRVSETGVGGANSFMVCADDADTTCTHALDLTVGIEPNLENEDRVVDDQGDPIPPVSLKVAAAGSGSLTQALDCDPGTGPGSRNLRDELATGCRPQYEVNDTVACPDSSGELDNVFGPNPSPTPPANTWPCVGTNQGAAVGQVGQGMNDRVFGASTVCADAPNHWYDDSPDFPTLDPADPRIVQVFLTPFGAFSTQGDTTVPVIGFATFYATGWDQSPCQGVALAAGGDDPAGQGEIVGHFIKYIDTLDPSGGGEDPCDFGALGSCVAVFTR